MNSNFQKLAIWVAILVLLAALFNLFNNPAQSQRGKEITYSEFLNAVDEGKVAEVTLAGSRIQGTMRDGAAAFSTYAPQDPTLVERLQKKNINFRARPSDDDVPSIMSMLLSWFPMLLLIAVWIATLRMRGEFRESIKRLIGVRDVDLEDLIIQRLGAETISELRAHKAQFSQGTSTISGFRIS